MAKANTDLHSNSFMQEAAARYLARRSHPDLLERLRDKYGARQRLLYNSLVAGMPAGTTVSQPEGGLSVWLTLPEGADVSELYFRAVRRGVAFVSGEVFYGSPSDSRSFGVEFRAEPGRGASRRRRAPLLGGQGSVEPPQRPYARHDDVIATPVRLLLPPLKRITSGSAGVCRCAHGVRRCARREGGAHRGVHTGRRND